MRLILFFLTIGLLTSCKSDENTHLPVLSYDYVNGKKQVYKIKDFRFLNQDSLKITSLNTKKSVHTFNFFFTSCPSICPKMKLKHQELASLYSENELVQYSISIDLKRDSISKLKHYSSIVNVSSEKWMFLKGESEEYLHQFAKKLKTNFKPNETYTDFYHSSYVALIDKNLKIRGFYDLLNDKDFELLKKDIILLNIN